MEASELVVLLHWGAIFALSMAARSLLDGVRQRRAAKHAEAPLPPELRIPELAPYAGPPGLAVATLRERGIQPEQVGVMMLYRGAEHGLCGPEALPPAVQALVGSLWAEGSARGLEVSELLHGGGLPPGRCLWFIQLNNAAGRGAQLVAFAGPDRGASDHA